MLSRVLDLWETSGAAEAAEHSSKQHSETEQWSRAVRRGLFFLSHTMHRSVATKILLPDMFFRCDTKNIGNYENFDGYRFCATRRKKKGPRSAMALDRRCFFQVTAEIQKCQLTLQPASEYADGADLPAQQCCIFVFFFFSFRPNAPLVFCEIYGRIGNEVSRKRKTLVTKRWVQLDKEKTMETYILVSGVQSRISRTRC